MSELDDMCPNCNVNAAIADELCEKHRLCPDCGIPKVWCMRVTSDPNRCWRWDYEQFDTCASQLESAEKAVRELRHRSDSGEPVAVDISDYSDEYCDGFLAGQSHAFDQALRAFPDSFPTPASNQDSRED